MRSVAIAQESFECSKQFDMNHCLVNSAPFLYDQCNKWEICKRRDPADVGYAKIAAELVAEIINNLIDPMSRKAMVC